MFNFIGSIFSGSPATVEDCDNIQYTPIGDGNVVVDDPEDTFSGIVPIDTLPTDIQEAITDAIDGQIPL